MFSSIDKLHVLHVKDQIQFNLYKKMSFLSGFNIYKEDWFLSGGAIGALIRGEEPNDYDIWFENIVVSHHMINLITSTPTILDQVKELTGNYFGLEVEGKLITPNAITMKNGLQFITNYQGSPDVVRKNFDFVHCLPYYSLSHKKLYISEQQYMACENKILIPNLPIQKIDQKRIAKFASQGWNTDAVKQVEDICL